MLYQGGDTGGTGSSREVDYARRQTALLGTILYHHPLSGLVPKKEQVYEWHHMQNEIIQPKLSAEHIRRQYNYTTMRPLTVISP